MNRAFLVLALACVAFAATGFEFTGTNFLIYNDPIVAGALVVNMKYDALMPSTASDSPAVNRGSGVTDKGVMSIEYLDSNGNVLMEEVTDYFFRFRFQYCPPCDAVTYKSPMPKFYLNGAGPDDYYTQSISSVVVNGRTCEGFQHPGAAPSASSKLWVDRSANPQQICRHEWGSGKTIDFLTPTSTFTYQAIEDHTIMANSGGVFRPVAPWADQCNTPACKVKLDIMFVVDESGSITSPDWEKAKQFVYQFFNSFTFGPDDVIGGVTKFAWASELYVQLTADKNYLLTQIQNMPQAKGNTCIGCGIGTGSSELQSSRGRATVPNIIIVVTDGYNNQQVSSFPGVVASAKAVPIELFGIGVGTFLDSTIDSFVSDPKADHKFIVENYSALAQVLNSVVTATCQEVPGSLCGAGCQGLCACATQCYCPASCEDFDQCTDEECIDGQNGNGCQYSTKDCNPQADVCNVYTCDPATGCVSTPLNCDDGNPCTDDFCGDPNDPTNAKKIQCSNPPRDCADNSVCTTDTCDTSITSGDPCVHTPVGDCAKCLDAFANPPSDIDCSLARFNPNYQLSTNCNPYVCDPNSPNERYDTTDPNLSNNGPGPCVAKPVNCDDGNPCTATSCEAATGNCVFGIGVSCNDGDPCTQDICDPKSTAADPCVFTPIDPAVLCADGDPCTNDLCDLAQGGCYHTPFVCDTSNECLNTSCISNQGGCVSANYTCSVPDSCHTATCVPQGTGAAFDEAKFCVVTEIEGTINKCGVCLGNDVSCFLEGSDVTVYAITGGVIAAIVIAIIVAVALGVFGGKKGYDYWKAKNGAGQQWSQNSAIYNAPPSGSNPVAT